MRKETEIKMKEFLPHESVLSYLKGRFLKFRRYYNFANLSSELLESTFYKRNKQVSVKSIEVTVLE